MVKSWFEPKSKSAWSPRLIDMLGEDWSLNSTQCPIAPAPLNAGALLWLRSRYDYDVNIMDNELSDGRAYFLGDELSIADCSLAGYLYFADEAKLPVPKHVQAWLDRLAALPEWFHPYD